MTGRYPTSIKIRGMGILPPSETTLPEWLRRHGYNTGAFGKVHLTPEQYTRNQLKSDVPILNWRCFAEDSALFPIADDPFKKDYGFEEHIGCDDTCQGNFIDWLKNTSAELVDKKGLRYADDGPPDLFVSPYPSACHQSTFIAGKAEEYIRSKALSGSPWLTFCSFIAPHHPFEAPEDQIERYSKSRITALSKELDVSIENPPAALTKAIGHKYSEDIQRRIILHYYASISLIDDCVGRLLAALDETGQRNNTIILFVSDHGEHLGNHGLLRKPSLHYDDILRVPMILNIPDRTCGLKVKGLVELVDVYPTLLGLLGLPHNPGVQGIDWSNALYEQDKIGREDIYCDMFEMDPMTHAKSSGPYCACRTIRTKKWKLNVYPTALLESSQLFDLENDPAESRNLFHDIEFRQIREEMLWRLIKRMNDNTDPLPLRLTQW